MGTEGLLFGVRLVASSPSLGPWRCIRLYACDCDPALCVKLLLRDLLVVALKLGSLLALCARVARARRHLVDRCTGLTVTKGRTHHRNLVKPTPVVQPTDRPTGTGGSDVNRFGRPTRFWGKQGGPETCVCGGGNRLPRPLLYMRVGVPVEAPTQLRLCGRQSGERAAARDGEKVSWCDD